MTASASSPELPELTARSTWAWLPPLCSSAGTFQGAASASTLAQVQARGVDVLDEVGMPEVATTCFEEWMGGFIATVKGEP